LNIFFLPEPEIPDIEEEETAEGEGGEQQQTEATAEDAEPKEQALGVSTPTGDEEPKKCRRISQIDYRVLFNCLNGYSQSNKKRKCFMKKNMFTSVVDHASK